MPITKAQIRIQQRIPFALDTQPRYSEETMSAVAEVNAYLDGKIDLPKYETPEYLWRDLDAEE